MTKKVLLVTGGSQGIGAAVAMAAAQRGYDVCLTYRNSSDAADQLVRAIECLGRRAMAVCSDASNETDVADLYAAIDARLGRISALVNNAGLTGPVTSIGNLDTSTFDNVIATNLRGCFLNTKEACRRMAEVGSGAIVNVSSRASELGGANEWVHYAASKGGVDSFTVGSSREFAASGIRINAVSPGLIATDLHARAGAPDRVARMGSAIPLGRAGTPEDVAKVVLWLLSDEASYVTGAIVPVSGGR
jgi:NAD(P)-dependent dehydrogenase (short-subunit alcohol dehydrogenase family)